MASPPPASPVAALSKTNGSGSASARGANASSASKASTAAHARRHAQSESAERCVVAIFQPPVSGAHRVHARSRHALHGGASGFDGGLTQGRRKTYQRQINAWWIECGI